MAKDFEAKITNKSQATQYFKATLPDSYRFAMAGTANRVAFEGIKKSNEQFRKEFVLSNKYLIGNAPGKGVLKFNKAIPHRDLDKIQSSWGVPSSRGQTDLKFLEDQETGFQHKGMVPTKNAYPGRNKNRVIKMFARRKGLLIKGTRGFPRGIANNNAQRTLFFLRQMYQQNFATEGTKQFIYLRAEDQFFNFREGMYQFTGSPISSNSFPKLRMIYAKDDTKNKIRKPTNWMEKSANAFKQSEIDKIWTEEFNKSFTKALSKLK